MAGALKHKQRSQYSYHDHKPYHQFHVHAAAVPCRKESTGHFARCPTISLIPTQRQKRKGVSLSLLHLYRMKTIGRIAQLRPMYP